jgi:rhamnogalacturonan endolyase
LTPGWSTASANDACHYLRIVQADGDPAHEVLNGAQLLDHDGTPLWAAGLGHLDSVQLADIRPGGGLEVLAAPEWPGIPGPRLLDAATGAELWRGTYEDTGGWAEDLLPDREGLEFYVWGGVVGSHFFLSTGEELTGYSDLGTPIDWDGDAFKEVTRGGVVWDPRTGAALQDGAAGVAVFALDVIGDYREELIVIGRDGAGIFLDVFSNTDPIPLRGVSPWENPLYGVNRQRSMIHEGLAGTE